MIIILYCQSSLINNKV